MLIHDVEVIWQCLYPQQSRPRYVISIKTNDRLITEKSNYIESVYDTEFSFGSIFANLQLFASSIHVHALTGFQAHDDGVYSIGSIHDEIKVATHGIRFSSADMQRWHL